MQICSVVLYIREWEYNDLYGVETLKFICIFVLAFCLISSNASFFNAISSNFAFGFIQLNLLPVHFICQIVDSIPTIKFVFRENLVMLVRIQLLLLGRLGHGGCWR